MSAPSLGAAAYQPAGAWNAALGYRWQNSDRHFTGGHEDVNRIDEGSQVINDIHLIDLSVSYAASKRVTISASLPFQDATRSQVVRATDPARTILERFHTSATGLGDLRLLATSWILDPEKNQKQNISLGLGLKLPTGEKDATDTFEVYDAKNKQIVAAQRTVDQSIQLGDGGYGVILDLLAFRQIYPRTTLYLAGTYILTPQQKNGVPTFRSNPFEAEMSIADQYLARVGVGYELLPKWGLSATLGGRIEGVPVHDFLGGSDGFRRPGISVDIEPGLVLARKGWTFAVSTPVALHRERFKSVPDLQQEAATGTPRHGDAAFADFMVLASVGRRF